MIPHHFHNRRAKLPVLFICLALVVLSSVARAASGGPDAFGYSFKDDAAGGGPAYQWVDIAATGSNVLSGTNALVATVNLDGPAYFYGHVHLALRVSRHGFLSTALTDDGNDPDNDSILPTVPGNNPGAGNRFYVLHDNLSLGTNGRVFYEYFSASPYTNHPGGVHVFQWDAVHHTGTPASTFSFQALVFVNGDVLFQYAPGNPEHGSGSTTGLQITLGTTNIGLKYAANTPNSVDDQAAVLFSAPRLIVTTAANETNLVPGTGVSLREAFDAAWPGATITFDASLSGATLDIANVSAPANVSVDASDLVDPPRLRHGSFGATGLALQHLHLDAPNSGFLILLSGYFYANECRFSGVTPVVHGSAILTHSSLPGSGGAIRLDHCVFESNAGLQGAALRLENSIAVVTDSTFRNNTGSVGGAVYATASPMTFRGCTFDANEVSSSGGAIYINNSPGGTPLTVENCTFSGNAATLFGGAIYANYADYSFFRHCTIYGNATGSGRALQINQAGSIALEFSHCAIGGNEGAGDGNYSGGMPTATDHTVEDAADLPLAGPGDRSRTDLRLGPLAWNGGPTRTHAPLALSRLIDAGSASADTPGTDQRGRSRIVDGDINGSAVPDVGACEAGPAVVVSTLSDENDLSPPYSLRDAVALVPHGGRVLFAPALNSGVIELAAAEGGLGTHVELTRDMMVDASSLPDGITVDGGDTNRLFLVADPHDVSLHAMTLRHGFAPSSGGGAVRNLRGNVTLNLCAVHDNGSAERGGALYVRGGSLLLENCTVAHNNTGARGGALADDPSEVSDILIRHSTVAFNTADDTGGGVALGGSIARWFYSILASNTVAGFPQNVHLSGSGTNLSLGYNLENGTGAGFTAPGDQQGATPQLQPLADHGGYSPVCATLTNSPARDVLNTRAPFAPRMDQRGFQRAAYANVSLASDRIDVGAYESRGDIHDSDGDGLPDWWERRTGLDQGNSADATRDHDNDGQNARREYQADTDPFDPRSWLRVTEIESLPASQSVRLTWPVVPGKTYEVWRSDNLLTWTYLGSGVAPAGSTEFSQIIPGANPNVTPARFYQVRTDR